MSRTTVRCTLRSEPRRVQMIKVSVFYANSPGVRFDMDYYIERHMPLVQTKSGVACQRVEVDQGLAGGAPGTTAPYVAIGHIFYETAEDFQSVFARHGEALLADIPNFTNVQPLIQISAVRS